MTRFAFEPIYGSLWLAVLVLVAVIVAISLIRPPTSDPVLRRRLIGLRVLAALVLWLALLRPSLIRTDTEPGEATLVIAVDTSRSMTLPDGEGADRWRTQLAVWDRLATELQQLDAALKVELIAYDEAARTLPSPLPDTLAEESPRGEATDLAAAIQAAMQSSGGRPLAGLVLIGDGTDTSTGPAGRARRMVETFNSIGVPLWTVPIGPASDETEARDAAIDALPESLQLFAGNEVEIGFEVRLRGLAGSDVPVTLRWQDETGALENVASRRVVATRSLDTIAVNVPLTVPPPGAYRLIVEAEQQDGELISENNRQVAFVDVREGGGRVLYIEGAPRLEQFFIRQSLRGFPDLDLTYRWIPADSRAGWPVDLGDWFDPGEFDVYIIGDVAAAALGDRQLEKLAEAVGAGSGLVMLGGFTTYEAGGYASSPLSNVVPIQFNSAWNGLASADRTDRPDQLAGPLTAKPTRSHPITDLGGADPTTVWRELPTLSGANRFAGIRAAPGVQVVLETDSSAPLLVVGEYGAGRTALLAIDSTYRWWRAGRQEVHRRFWRQLILWLLAREETGGDVINVRLDARRFASTDVPNFQAQVQSVNPDTQVDLVAELIDSQARVKSVPVSTLAAGQSGGAEIQGAIPTLPPGFYRLRVRDQRPESTLEPAQLAFQVVDNSRELERPLADPVYLNQLAKLTSDHGGQGFSPDQVDSLIEEISARRRRAETTVVAKHRLGDGPLSGWLLFALFAAALTGEWWLRRAHGIA